MTSLASVTPGDSILKVGVEKKIVHVRRTSFCSLKLVLDIDDWVAFQRLTQWFPNRVTAENGWRDVLAWLPLLQQLHQTRNPRPRQRSTTQQFMLDHADVVDATFLHQHGVGSNFTAIQKVNLRHSLAKSLLSVSGQYSHLKDKLDKMARAQHDVAMDEWNLVLGNISSAGDVALYVLPPYFLVPIDPCLHS